MDAGKTIKIVGWAWTIIGGGMILSGTVGSIFLFVVFQRMFPPNFNTDLIPYYDLLMWFRWAYPIQFLVGIFVFVCGRKFLKKYQWPRKYLEGFSWFFLAFSIIWSFVMAFIIFRIEGDLMGLFAIPVMVPYIALFGFLVYQLRSEKVWEALGGIDPLALRRQSPFQRTSMCVATGLIPWRAWSISQTPMEAKNVSEPIPASAPL